MRALGARAESNRLVEGCVARAPRPRSYAVGTLQPDSSRGLRQAATEIDAFFAGGGARATRATASARIESCNPPTMGSGESRERRSRRQLRRRSAFRSRLAVHEEEHDERGLNGGDEERNDKVERTGLTSLITRNPPMPPKLNRSRALFVLTKIDEILAWGAPKRGRKGHQVRRTVVF